MKKIISLFIALLTSLSLCLAGGPEDPVRLGFFELELSCGPIWGSSYEYDAVQVGFQGLAELRANMPKSPLDAGIQFSSGRFNRTSAYVETKGYTKNTGAVVGFLDYNVLITPDVDFYFGAGIGGCNCEYLKVAKINEADPQPQETSRFVICPRMGVELVQHFRCTFEYKFMASMKYSYAALNLGWSFGGGDGSRKFLMHREQSILH